MKGASTVPKLKEVTIGDFIIWLNPRVGKMKRFLCSDWLPRGQDGLIAPARDLPRIKVPQEKVLFLAIFYNNFLYRLSCSVKILDIGIVCP